MPVHPTAIVSPTARIAETAEIGPYSIIGDEVEIGARTRLMAHVYMEGPLRAGQDNFFFPYSSIGAAPHRSSASTWRVPCIRGCCAPMPGRSPSGPPIGSSCYAGSYICPLDNPGPAGAPCTCPTNSGRIAGQVR